MGGLRRVHGVLVNAAQRAAYQRTVPVRISMRMRAQKQHSRIHTRSTTQLPHTRHIGVSRLNTRPGFHQSHGQLLTPNRFVAQLHSTHTSPPASTPLHSHPFTPHRPHHRTTRVAERRANIVLSAHQPPTATHSTSFNSVCVTTYIGGPPFRSNLAPWSPLRPLHLCPLPLS